MSPCRWDYIFTDEVVGVWRVVSEDSDHLSTWLAVIHRFGDRGDFQQSSHREVLIRRHQPQALGELLKVELLRRSQ